jgi:hypothetical protein
LRPHDSAILVPNPLIYSAAPTVLWPFVDHSAGSVRDIFEGDNGFPEHLPIAAREVVAAQPAPRGRCTEVRPRFHANSIGLISD